MHQDFKDLLSIFNAHNVEYIVVGAHALAAHGHVRATKDIDIWIRATDENAARAYAALGAFGAPLHELRTSDLATPGIVFQIGVAPIRIDIITRIDGVEFQAAWDDRLKTTIGELEVAVLSRKLLFRQV